MAKKVITSPANAAEQQTEGLTLEQCRKEAADIAMRDYGASLRYARKMVETWGLNFWRKQSEHFKQYQEERLAYIGILKAANHTNPSQEWNRVIEKADAICNPKVPGEANGTSSLHVRQIDWLKAMFKSGRREDKKHGLSDAEKEIHLAVMKILREVCKINPEDIK